jgi:WD40 repeat protein
VLVTGGSDGDVRLWDPEHRTALGALVGHTGWVLWGAWGRIGDRAVLATGGHDGVVRL